MGLWRDPRRLRELEATLDAIDEAIMTVDREYCVVGFNRAAEQLTGYSRREALGGRCFEVCAGRFCQHSCDIQAMFTTGETPPDFETVVQGKDGRLRVVRVRTVPFRDDRGEILAAIRILKDVTGTVPLTPADPAAEAALIGASPAMERVRQAVDALQDSEAPVLIWGPPGTEKERLARAIHSRSLRAGGPFIPLRPSGPETLARPEVERALLLARAGSLFVANFSELPQPLQEAILQACHGGAPNPPDPSPHPHLPPRLLAGADAAGEGHEASGPSWSPPAGWHLLELPPLKERREDIPLLADHCLKQLRLTTGAQVTGLTARALRALMSYPFPGNVQELEEILRFAVAFRQATWAERLGERRGQGTANALDWEDLPPEVQAAWPGARAEVGPQPSSQPPPAQETSPPEGARAQLLAALEANGWHMSRTAEQLGINRTTLWRRMKRLRIERPGSSA